MKKQGLFVAFAVFVTLLFATCSSESDVLSFEELSIARPLQIHPEIEYLVYMVAADVTSTHVTVTIQNNSDFHVFTGEHYTLEAYYNGQWLYVPMVELFGFTFVAHTIEPHDSKSFNKPLWPFPPLGAESYRIRKDIGITRWGLYELPDGRMVPIPLPPPERPAATPPPPTPTPSPPDLSGEFHPSMIDGIPTPPPPRRLPSHEVVAEFDWGR